MSWDLWGPPHHQVEPECGDDALVPVQPPQCDFRADVIEEDVLNDKSRVQVLRILIAKDDAEIEELEEFLVSLQCELAWEEHEEFYDICCDALKERIDSLEASLRKLRSNARDSATDISTNDREPVERSHDILKALLRDYRPKHHGKAEETRIGTSSLNTQLTSVSESNRQLEPTHCASETAFQEHFQQLTDVIADLNTPNILKKKFEAKPGAFEDSVVQPATSNTILDSRNEMGKPMSAASDETHGLSLEREGKREDRKFSLASIAHLQDQGSKNIPGSQSCKGEDEPAELVQLNEVTANDKSKWTLQLFEHRPKMKRKIELDGPGAERSPYPRKENCSLTSKAKVFGIKNSSFNKPITEKMGKKALSALPPQEKGEILQNSEGRPHASVNINSPVSQKKGARDVILKESSPLTESDKLHKQLVKSPVDAEVNLEGLKVKDLRAIAKQNKLTQYSKLRKKELVEKIASSLEPQ